MARQKKPKQLVITEEDGKIAAQHNTVQITAAIKGCKDKIFEAFIEKNEELLAHAFKEKAPYLFKDHTSSLPLDQRKDLLIGLLEHAQAKTVFAINSNGLLNQRKLTTPETVAQVRQDDFERAENRRQHRNQSFMGAAAHIREGLYDAGVVALSAAKIGLVGTRALAKTTVLPAAKILAGAIHAIPASNYTKIKASLFATATAAALMSAPVLDSDELMLDMNLENAFLKACTPDIRSMTPANIAYALNFNTNAQDHPRDAHAYQTMMAASDHDVPLIALHMIGYFESQKFSDMVSNNSSASNPFQMIDSTKALLIHKYGQETSVYKAAQAHIENGNASTTDKSLVLAFDTLAKTSMDTLNSAIKNQKMSGAVHDALAYANLSDIAAQLMALDIKEKYPDITNPALSPEQIADITVQYYTDDHFLGSKNYDLLLDMAEKHPDMSLTDSKTVQKAYSESVAKKLAEIVQKNPTFLKEGITAPEALKSIQTHFMSYVQEPYQKFAAHYDSSTKMRDLCLTDEGKKVFPAKISQLDKIAYTHGFDGLKGVLQSFTKSASLEESGQKLAMPAKDSISAAIEEAIRDSTKDVNPLNESIHPKAKPSTSALKSSMVPKLRPDGLGNG